MIPSRNIRVLAILQAASITGSAKSVLEFAREATSNRGDAPSVDFSIVLLSQSRGENNFTEAMRCENIGFDVVLERRKLDRQRSLSYER